MPSPRTPKKPTVAEVMRADAAGTALNLAPGRDQPVTVTKAKTDPAPSSLPGASQDGASQDIDDSTRGPTRFGDWEKKGRCVDF